MQRQFLIIIGFLAALAACEQNSIHSVDKQPAKQGGGKPAGDSGAKPADATANSSQQEKTQYQLAIEKAEAEVKENPQLSDFAKSISMVEVNEKQDGQVEVLLTVKEDRKATEFKTPQHNFKKIKLVGLFNGNSSEATLSETSKTVDYHVRGKITYLDEARTQSIIEISRPTAKLNLTIARANVASGIEIEKSEVSDEQFKALYNVLTAVKNSDQSDALKSYAYNMISVVGGEQEFYEVKLVTEKGQALSLKGLSINKEQFEKSEDQNIKKVSLDKSEASTKDENGNIKAGEFGFISQAKLVQVEDAQVAFDLTVIGSDSKELETPIKVLLKLN